MAKLDPSGNFIWAKGFGGSGYYDTLGNLYDARCYAACILRDSTCGLYFCGHFQGDIDFDPGTQVVNLNTSGGTGAFICKLDTGGHYIWARQIGGLGFDCECDGLCLGENNSLYLTGTFSGTVDFDSGPNPIQPEQAMRHSLVHRTDHESPLADYALWPSAK